VVGFTLGYFAGDYDPVDEGLPPTDLFEARSTGSNFLADDMQLYGGQIAHSVTANRAFGVSEYSPMGVSYRYDQLYRLTRSNVHNYLDVDGNAWMTGVQPGQAYGTAYSYDPNGNIKTLARFGPGTSAASLNLDELSYRYDGDGIDEARVDNRLQLVSDAVANSPFDGDLETQGDNIADPNYLYDKLGRMVADWAEEIEKVAWDIHNKVRRVERFDGSDRADLQYSYDAAGDRVIKHSTRPTLANDGTRTRVEHSWTYYIRDARGRILSVYEKKRVEDLTGGTLSEEPIEQRECVLQGTGRIGVWDVSSEAEAVPGASGAGILGPFSRTVGAKTFELTNHLGNVLATISDAKRLVTDDGPVHFIAQTKSVADYYPFGMVMPERDYQSESYRYGFNGMERDDDWKGEGNQYDTRFRQYDPRLGRWLSVDPKHQDRPHESPFAMANNCPTWLTDPMGAQTDKAEQSQTTDKESDAADGFIGEIRLTRSEWDYYASAALLGKAAGLFSWVSVLSIGAEPTSAELDKNLVAEDMLEKGIITPAQYLKYSEIRGAQTFWNTILGGLAKGIGKGLRVRGVKRSSKAAKGKSYGEDPFQVLGFKVDIIGKNVLYHPEFDKRYQNIKVLREAAEIELFKPDPNAYHEDVVKRAMKERRRIDWLKRAAEMQSGK
jgi:RHS repeat-associated protein